MDNNSSVFLIVGGIFVIVAIVLVIFIRKRLQSAWKGVVSDKKEFSDTDDNGTTSNTYYLYIKTDDGKQIKVDVSKKFYETYKVGDHLQKKAGEYNPVKV